MKSFLKNDTTSKLSRFLETNVQQGFLEAWILYSNPQFFLNPKQKYKPKELPFSLVFPWRFMGKSYDPTFKAKVLICLFCFLYKK